MAEDHRTDLYSLGIFFWTLLVGRGTSPFEGGPLQLLHAIVQKRPMPVHEIRRDVPQVLAAIIEKLLSKNPEARYQSALGVRNDLMECQKRLLEAVSLASENASELIPYFPIGAQDKFIEFTLPRTLFGRDRESETLRGIIRQTSESFASHSTSAKGPYVLTSSGSQYTGSGSGCGTEDHSDTMSSDGSVATSLHRAVSIVESVPSPSLDQQSTTGSGDSLSRFSGVPSSRVSRTRAVFVVGPAGAGKTSLVLANQATWRCHGLWGQAKFQRVDSAPFSGLLSCLSAVLRQFMVFDSDLHRFIAQLKHKLGPQLILLPLLYHGAPELKDILAAHDIHIQARPEESLDTSELRTRFQTLMVSILSIIAEIRLLALFLDDLQEADDYTLGLIETLANSRTRMLIFGTLRAEKQQVVDRLRRVYPSSSRATWITLEPLGHQDVSNLVSHTLRRPIGDCVELSHLLLKASSGNAFSARSILLILHRQGHIKFDMEKNHWDYDFAAIEKSLIAQNVVSDPSDVTYLVIQLRQLPKEARMYIIWALFFGTTFKVTEVALMMDWSSGNEGDEEPVETWDFAKALSTVNDESASIGKSINGQQIAISEGWLVNRARDMCSFTHDRYRQAAQAELDTFPEEVVAKMSLKVILMMLHGPSTDVYRIAEHSKRCLPLLRRHAKRDELVEALINAGEATWTRGAHELAIKAFENARCLQDDDAWVRYPERTCLVNLRLIELTIWKGNYDEARRIVLDCLSRPISVEERARVLRLRSRINWMQGSFDDALNDSLAALHILGIEVPKAPTERDQDIMFEQVKDEILEIGFDEILGIPRATDPRTDLAVAVLNDAGTNAYWGEGYSDIIGLTTIKLALRSGMSPGTSMGFFWVLGVSAERRELYRFSADLGKLALRIAEKHGSSMDKCRSQVMFCAMVSGFDNVHYRANLSRMDIALKHGKTAGDGIYCGFATLHANATRLYICDHLSELVVAAEESLNDVKLWSPNAGLATLLQGLLNCIRALGGYTTATSPENLFDTGDFVESEYYKNLASQGHMPAITLNWYDGFKVVAYFCLGYVAEAAERGFFVYETRNLHPNHRHSRYILFFHCLALIDCVRKGRLAPELRKRYMDQVERNTVYIKKWLSPSPVNNSAWIALVDAEIASLNNTPDAFKLYDVAVKLSINNDWPMEEGYSLYLQGCHFVRCDVEGLGTELQRRGIQRHFQWGARGITNHLSSVLGPRSQKPLKRHIFSSDVGVQTETVVITPAMQPPVYEQLSNTEAIMDDSDMSPLSLSVTDLSSILKWSKEISSDINLAAALQRFTEISAEICAPEKVCLVIAREAGDYSIATTMEPPGECHVHVNSKPVGSIRDALQKAVIEHVLNSKERLCFNDVTSDSRFLAEASESVHRSVICLPIVGNRGQTSGAIYLASKYPFTQRKVTMIHLLCQQATISITNALLFRSVQAGTRENLRMIDTQKKALAIARQSREDALKATKIKSNFLASMSHELRTPFSSFYGLLDILSGTELNPGQRETVQTAKESCELLLKIIDSILDYSKLEASAVKLDSSAFSVENIVADCLELLLPLAAERMDLSYYIHPNVPAWIHSDYARIRQVLMNLIGNAVKFTDHGSVKCTVSVDLNRPTPDPEMVSIKFIIQDTGIGLSKSHCASLFVPFQQADNSTTRRFGGTGLGLSISRELAKLLGGGIGVTSELGRGSTFWFTFPVTVDRGPEANKSTEDLELLRTQLTHPRPVQILLCSPSDTTLRLLETMFFGFRVASTRTQVEARRWLEQFARNTGRVDFVILDTQSGGLADDLATVVEALGFPSLADTKIVHIYTPTKGNSSGTSWRDGSQKVLRLTKPPRTFKMLQTLVQLRNPAPQVTVPVPKKIVEEKSVEDVNNKRNLAGMKVLIAEDNPIARKLLKAQLERVNLQVETTTNGEEAIAAWEKYGPGYFQAAMFDHHMPVCDGVEAAKRIRALEVERGYNVRLPSKLVTCDVLLVALVLTSSIS
ncbi:histidine kinase [Thelephora ganbajun]|uniref:Histidine kinase n=1 Tax=Thelephora ganbajun TaxID=370292 RepID=A0ACB6ZXT4_THEGA|nr:histidine kinase [Thelephora ganbajun]